MKHDIILIYFNPASRSVKPYVIVAATCRNEDYQEAGAVGSLAALYTIWRPNGKYNLPRPPVPTVYISRALEL